MDHHNFPEFPNPADAQYYYYPSTPPPPITEVNTMPDVYQMVMDLGIPACVIIAAFWFIRYQSELAKAERAEFWKKDEEHDARLLDMIEKSSDAILQIKLALDANTNAIKDLMGRK